MKEVRQIAAEYAVAQTNEVMSLAIAKAYEDGYRDGYRERDEEISIDLRDNKTEYVDLGLPSGTLWTADYERKDGKWMYLPYEKASKLSIPTEEQWNELLEMCKWEFEYISDNNVRFVCIGPNGSAISFYNQGYIKYEGNLPDGDIIRAVFFWINDETEGLEKNVVKMHYYNGQHKDIEKRFSGYKLPVRLVRH